MPTLPALGDRLSECRRVQGITQLQLAMRCGVSERTIRNAERGRPIKRDFLNYIAAGLGLSMEDVVPDTAQLSSYASWQRNVENLMTAIRDIFDARPSYKIFNISHCNLTCQVRGFLPGSSSCGNIFGDYHGITEFRHLVDRVRDLRLRYGDVDCCLEEPVGGAGVVVLRCGIEVPMPSGKKIWSRSVLVCEFEMLKLRRLEVLLVAANETRYSCWPGQSAG